MAKFILPRLKLFKELNCGNPCDFTEESWDEVLDKMIFAMQAIADGSWSYENEDIEEARAYWNRVQEGLELFGKYFRDLWW